MQRDELQAITKQLDEIKLSLSDLKKDVGETKEIVEAWATVKNVGKGVKWLSGFIIAVTAILVSIKLAVAHLIR